MAGSGGTGGNRSVVWPKPDHTDAKHRILKAYLSGWYPILGRWSGRVIYLDAFAGPGVYAGGEPGSPIIALDTLLNHSRLPSLRTCEFRFNFLEADAGRLAQLEKEVNDYKAARGGLPPNVNVRSSGDTFEVAAGRMLAYLEDRDEPMPPTFAFIDPFGHKGLPLHLIGRLLDAKKCELCVHFMLGSITRWIRRGRSDPDIQKLFGTDEYREAEQMNGARRQLFLLELYKRQLREVAKFSYVCSLSLFGIRNRWISAIVYATNNIRGMEVMKRAMWTVDQANGGRFSDRDYAAGQLNLFGSRDAIDGQVQRALVTRFRGQQVSVQQIERFVVADTDYGPQHWRPALRALEKSGAVRTVGGPSRRSGTFAAGTMVDFMR